MPGDSSITRQDQQHMTACSFTCHFAAAPDALPGGLQQQLAVCSNTCLAAPGWLRLVGCTCRAAPAPGGLQQQQLLSCTTSSSCPMQVHVKQRLPADSSSWSISASADRFQQQLLAHNGSSSDPLSCNSRLTHAERSITSL